MSSPRPDTPKPSLETSQVPLNDTLQFPPHWGEDVVRRAMKHVPISALATATATAAVHHPTSDLVREEQQRRAKQIIRDTRFSAPPYEQPESPFLFLGSGTLVCEISRWEFQDFFFRIKRQRVSYEDAHGYCFTRRLTCMADAQCSQPKEMTIERDVLLCTAPVATILRSVWNWKQEPMRLYPWRDVVVTSDWNCRRST